MLSYGASAGLILKIEDIDNATSFTVADGSAGDISSATGSVAFAYTSATFDVLVSVGTSSKRTALNEPLTFLDLGVTGTGMGQFVVSITDTDFQNPNGDVSFHAQGVTNARGGATQVSSAFFADAGNAEFGTGIDLGTVLNNGAFTSTANLNGDYSLTIVSTITADGMISTDNSVTVPEPGTLALLAAGIVALGLVRRRHAG